MTTRLALLTLSVILGMALGTRTAKADCVEYWDFGPQPCTVGQCQSQWEDITCGFGCVSGTCSMSNSTECCGVLHHYAQIYGDRGNDCSGVECGDARPRIHAKSSQVNPEHRAELLQGYTPGFIMLSADLSSRDPELVYIFSRCSHSYVLVVEHGKALAREGI